MTTTTWKEWIWEGATVIGLGMVLVWAVGAGLKIRELERAVIGLQLEVERLHATQARHLALQERTVEWIRTSWRLSPQEGAPGAESTRTR